MADRIDRILRDYFSGLLDLKIMQREEDLRRPHADDEDKYQEIVKKDKLTGKIYTTWKKVYSRTDDDNIGGGRAQNKHSRPADDEFIRIQMDPVLNKLKSQREDIQRWLATYEPHKRMVVGYYYSSRLITWTKVAQKYHISERTAMGWRAEIKHILGAVL